MQRALFFDYSIDTWNLFHSSSGHDWKVCERKRKTQLWVNLFEYLTPLFTWTHTQSTSEFRCSDIPGTCFVWLFFYLLRYVCLSIFCIYFLPKTLFLHRFLRNSFTIIHSVIFSVLNSSSNQSVHFTLINVRLSSADGRPLWAFATTNLSSSSGPHLHFLSFKSRSAWCLH